MRLGELSAGRNLAARWSCTILFAAASFLAGQELGSGLEQRRPMIGQQAPDFALAAIDGETVRLSDFRGKFVVIHFAADW